MSSCCRTATTLVGAMAGSVVLRPVWAGGALHLAIASNRGATIYGLDKVMIKAGKTLGVPESAGVFLAGYGD